MKIGIVTVFYTENCGSILQATALSDKLRDLGNEVFFISTINKESGHSKKRLIKNCLKKMYKKESIKETIKKYNYYSKYIKSHFNIINNKKEKSLDIIIIGSDTTWDITSKYFMLSQKQFWGIEYTGIPIISYATSIANSSYEELDKLEYPLNQLKLFKDISVRDNYTKEYVESRTKRNVPLVCDPTLLYDRDYYIKKATVNIDSDYLLLYLFNEPDDDIKKEIVSFCQKKDLKIVSLIGNGKIISFADQYIEPTIDNFLSYFFKAKYVITNTFHGTIFSLIFNKEFLVLDYKKVKISQLLEQINLSDRIISKNVENGFDTLLNYSVINTKLASLKKLGEDFLKRNLK